MDYKGYNAKNRKKHIIFTLITLLAIIIVWIVFSNRTVLRNITICPMYNLTGLKCPGCGMTHAAYSLLRLNFLEALKHNFLIYLFVPYIIWMYVKHIRYVFWDKPVRNDLRVVFGLFIITMIFTIVRNLV